jgi:hypothetical protein
MGRDLHCSICEAFERGCITLPALPLQFPAAIKTLQDDALQQNKLHASSEASRACIAIAAGELAMLWEGVAYPSLRGGWGLG